MTQEAHLQAVFTLLEDERRALLAGEYDLLQGYWQTKQTLIDTLGLGTLPPAQIDSLHNRLARNASLLDHAAQGFQDARQILTRLRAGHDTQMYDRDGTCKTMRQITNQLEHKA